MRNGCLLCVLLGITIPNEMSFLPTSLTLYLIIIKNVDRVSSWSHVGRCGVWYPIFALIERRVVYWNVVWRGVQRRFMIVEGLSMGFAFNVREKGGSLASGWSRHGIWTPLCGLLLKVCGVKFHKVSFSSVLFNLMFKIVQRLQQETVVLFTHKASKFRERAWKQRWR